MRNHGPGRTHGGTLEASLCVLSHAFALQGRHGNRYGMVASLGLRCICGARERELAQSLWMDTTVRVGNAVDTSGRQLVPRRTRVQMESSPIRRSTADSGTVTTARSNTRIMNSVYGALMVHC